MESEKLVDGFLAVAAIRVGPSCSSSTALVLVEAELGWVHPDVCGDDGGRIPET